MVWGLTLDSRRGAIARADQRADQGAGELEPEGNQCLGMFPTLQGRFLPEAQDGTLA
jgi:hypothetical protein